MAVKPTKRTRQKPERSGLGNVDENLRRNADRRNKNRPDWVKFADGETVVVRVIDPDEHFVDGYVHQVEFEGRGKGKRSYYRDVMCLDQRDEGTPCPGCRDDLDRRYKFWCLVIERDAAEENSKGKVVGYSDKVKIMSGATRLVRELNKKHKRHGLESRDIEISREGESFDTTYEVEWVDEEDVPLSKTDKKLIAESRIDLGRYTSIPDFDDFYKAPGSDDDDDEDVGKRSLRRGSGFSERGGRRSSKKRKSRLDEDEDDEDFDDDEDDDDEDDRPLRRRRKSNSASKPTALARLAAKKKQETKRRTKRRT